MPSRYAEPWPVSTGSLHSWAFNRRTAPCLKDLLLTTLVKRSPSIWEHPFSSLSPSLTASNGFPRKREFSFFATSNASLSFFCLPPRLLRHFLPHPRRGLVRGWTPSLVWPPICNSKLAPHWLSADPLEKRRRPAITHWHRPLLFPNQLICPTVATTVVSLWLTLIVTFSTLLRVLFWGAKLAKVVPLPWCGSPTLKRVSCVRPFRRNEFIRALGLVRRLTLTFLLEFNFGSRFARNWCVLKLFERLLFSCFYFDNEQMLLIGERLIIALCQQLSKLHPM